MAGNKMSSKTKSKEMGKMKNSQQDDENEDEIDFSVLRKPIMTSTTGFARAKKIFDFATEELKGLMGNECDLLYECKVCRNIFRSLPNFISHKRVYCKEKFDQRSHGHFVAPASLTLDLQKIKNLENNYQESLANGNAENEESDDDRIPMSRDLTAVIEKLTKTKGVSKTDGINLKLQKIPSSSAAVFQNVNFDDDDESSNNSMRSQVLELDNILSQDKAVLQSDGKFTVEKSVSDDVIHISDDDDDQAKLKCKICNIQFSTAKTLRFHMKYKHVASRLVFPCPDCLDIFSNSWSVYRHLFKVHRKSAAQIRRLRESIQAKAFRMNNPPAYYERRKPPRPAPAAPLSEGERRERENQAWMSNMESDGASPRCGGCGRAFERRAALLAHTATCGARGRALLAHTGARGRALAAAKRIEIQIRRDYHKGPEKTAAKKEEAAATSTKLGQDENAQCSFSKTTEKKPLEEAKMFIDDEQNSNSADKESSSPAESPEKVDELTEMTPKEMADKPKMKFLFTMQAEKRAHNLKALKQVITSRADADTETFKCKKCDNQCKNMIELCDHMAGHYKWMRFSCKLCNYKNYYFEKLSEHVKIVHRLKGDTDFYYSTVKAIDGSEAMELIDSEGNEDGSDIRRASRASSDSSRLSDDSSNSSAKVEGVKKRKMNPGRGKHIRKKEVLEKDETDNLKSKELSMDKVIQAIFSEKDQRIENPAEEDVEISRKQVDITSEPYRRPVRNRAKRKNADFEYDLSNLLKMEAQGYRDSQTTPPTKVTPTVSTAKVQRKKSLPEATSPLSNDSISRNFAGALLAMAKKSVQVGASHFKPFDMSVFKAQPKDNKMTFARPLIPKFATRADKLSPKRHVLNEEKLEEGTELEILNVGAKTVTKEETTESPEKLLTPKLEPEEEDNETAQENKDGKDDYIPAMVPVKFHRESMEVMKNPIINKSLSDFSKAGMKTKILVIKPINKSNENIQRLKFQRIKLKDPTKRDESQSDKVMLVKVPPVVVQKPETVKDTNNEHPDEKEASDNNEIITETNSTENSSSIVSNGDCNGVAHKETVIDNVNNESANIEMEVDEAGKTNESMEVEETNN